ncbi:MAG: type I-B CRISPR-associated protein Cas7/Csh2 [Candidatus Thorarchaeota archaeon]
MTEDILKHRHELLFLYDAKFVNPNGDPADENRPRIDEDTERNIVTDVRLKRTIRDYLHDFRGKEIFIREISMQDGSGIQDAKTRFNDFAKPFKDSKLSTLIEKGRNKILDECIDIRLFGAVIPVEKSEKEKGAVVLVGPTQFRMGQSLHKVDVKFIQGTGAFASEAGKGQKTFREEYVLPYSLIAFYGLVNENAAKQTLMTENDMDLLLEGMWSGTKNLISRSKVGQTPHLLLDVIYRENHYHHGDLDRLISLKSDLPDQEIRDPRDYHLEIGPLVDCLSRIKDKILKVRIAVSDALRCCISGEESDPVSAFKERGILVERMDF